MDLSFGADAPAEMTTPEEVERTQWEQEHRRHRNSERLEGEEVDKEKGEAAARDRGEEENTNRLPAASASAPLPMASKPMQFAIFFDGAICVYDDIPLEKAQAIILIAAATAAAAHAASPVLAGPNSLQSSSVAVSPQNQQQLLANVGSPLCKLRAELPIARRNSLQRFLEKRHNRLVSRAPYPPMKSADSPGDGTGSESSTPTDYY